MKTVSDHKVNNGELISMPVSCLFLNIDTRSQLKKAVKCSRREKALLAKQYARWESAETNPEPISRYYQISNFIIGLLFMLDIVDQFKLTEFQN